MFVTMKGSLEHDLLCQNLGVASHAIETMKLDTFQTFYTTDVTTDPRLKSALHSAGLAGMLKLADELREFNRISQHRHVDQVRRCLGWRSSGVKDGADSQIGLEFLEPKESNENLAGVERR
jgi:hypothetical protein